MPVKKCLIVDDEPAAHYVLANYIRQNPMLELVQQCYNGIEALNYLRDHEVDLMFLDINMPEITGLELLQTLPHPPKTILTTAYSEFALESYDYGVIDYLLKPIYFPRFLKATERFFASVGTDKQTHTPAFITIKIDSSVVNIDVQDILYAQSYGNYVKIITPAKTWLATMTTAQLEQSLPSEQFVRVHKSYIVALDKIQASDRDTVTIGDEKIPVGITYRREMADRLKHL